MQVVSKTQEACRHGLGAVLPVSETPHPGMALLGDVSDFGSPQKRVLSYIIKPQLDY
jgi:hypothetical protein